MRVKTFRELHGEDKTGQDFIPGWSEESLQLKIIHSTINAFRQKERSSNTKVLEDFFKKSLHVKG
jgi:hypothetical protein